MKLVLVIWEDAFHPASCYWHGKEESQDFIKDSEYICESVGWILHEDKRMLTLVSSKSSKSGSFMHHQRIPKGTILKVKKLK